MLAQSFRVRKDDFELIIKKGGYIQSPFFTVRYLPSANKTNFAVVVSKTVSKSAVVRNKIKRRIWAAISNNKKTFKNNHNIIFFAKKGSDKASFSELTDSVSISLKKANLIQ